MKSLFFRRAKSFFQSSPSSAFSHSRNSPYICEHICSNNHFSSSPTFRAHFNPLSSFLKSSHPIPGFPSGIVQKKLHGFLSRHFLVRPFIAGARLNGLLIKGVTASIPRVGFRKSQFLNQSFRFGGDPYRSYGRRRRFFYEGFTVDGVVLGLILSNVAVFLLWRVADHSFMKKNFMISVENFRSGHIHTLITSAFSHIDVGHIVSNMIGLYFFGISIGRSLGPDYLLKLYFTGAVVGSIFYLVHHAFLEQLYKERRMWGVDPSRVPGLGASGAVNAIMLLNIFLFPKSTIFFEFFIPVPAILMGVFLIGQDLLRIIQGDPHISGSAHLGGAAVAAVAWLRLRKGMRF